MRKAMFAAAILSAAGPSAAGSAPPLPAAATAGPMDYARPASWLCLPAAPGARPDACAAADLRVTDLGPSAVAPAAAAPAPAIDCFYVYPTVSRQPAGNADGRLTADEVYVAQQQFARFRDACRPFAPLYRQVTLASIGGRAKGDGAIAYADVKAAWLRYLAADNAGRGVILIGHSQGARHLQRLLAEEISGKPAQTLLVAAYLIGFNIAVPAGADSGGDLGAVPLCRAAGQAGCAVAYVSFPAAAPPLADARFGRAPAAKPGTVIACVNPAAIAGGTNRSTAILPVRSRPIREGDAGRQLIPGDWRTPSLRLNGLFNARCTDEAGAQYLAVSSELPALETGLQQLVQPDAGWGLHVVDVNLFLGDLVALAKAQGRSWTAGGVR